ncbi:MAG: tRNA (guanosine(46)-N7)-methyltransferase TrmB [Bacilli bacterium]|jgi:tRNA (guanine-N7-)-methyltransferase|nr:tRNA (guanosine(46)-N7)-methyltransferase TrmB [Bacilli bacterium]
MRLRNVKNAYEIVNNSPYVLSFDEACKHRSMFREEVFHNLNPIHLEIGMGKGNFLIDMAMKNPDINFVGVERYESVVCRAIEKLDMLEKPLENIKILCVDAYCLDKIFGSDIDTIYLNFSDPWPKNRHRKRRLSSHTYLPIYDVISRGDTIIEQKTDNLGLFASTIVSLSTYGYVIEEVSFDLASTDKPNSLTEYEEKFMSQGVKINYLKAIKRNE